MSGVCVCVCVRVPACLRAVVRARARACAILPSPLPECLSGHLTCSSFQLLFSLEADGKCALLVSSRVREHPSPSLHHTPVIEPAAFSFAFWLGRLLSGKVTSLKSRELCTLSHAPSARPVRVRFLKAFAAPASLSASTWPPAGWDRGAVRSARGQLQAPGTGQQPPTGRIPVAFLNSRQRRRVCLETSAVGLLDGYKQQAISRFRKV